MIWLIVMVGLMGFMAIWFLMIVLFGMEGNGGLELLRKVPEVVK
jgi:Trk-type K+ transport system membrane component